MYAAKATEAPWIFLITLCLSNCPVALSEKIPVLPYVPKRVPSSLLKSFIISSFVILYLFLNSLSDSFVKFLDIDTSPTFLDINRVRGIDAPAA